MALQQPFTTASPALANYNYSDIATGTGYETYYLIESKDSNGTDYHLTKNTDYSNSVKITKSAGAVDYDYDYTTFNIPRTVNGTVLISIAAYTVNTTFTAELYRWDGSTETQLGSTATLVDTSGVKMIYMRIEVDNELIPAGQTLRFRLRMSEATGSTAMYGVDPANRTDGTLTTTTTSKIHVPYKLDL